MIAILIIEETEGTSTAGGIVDNLGNHLIDNMELYIYQQFLLYNH